MHLVDKLITKISQNMKKEKQNHPDCDGLNGFLPKGVCWSFHSQYLRMWLCSEAEATKVKFSHMGRPSSKVTSVLNKRRLGHRHPHRIKAAAGEPCTRERKKSQNETNPAKTWILNFQPSELWGNTFLLFKPPACYFYGCPRKLIHCVGRSSENNPRRYLSLWSSCSGPWGRNREIGDITLGTMLYYLAKEKLPKCS